jgi:hypothetical protein
VPAALVALCFAAGLTLPRAIGGYAAILGLLFFFPLMVIVVLFNWPKILVPPASRGDDGTVTEMRRRRAANRNASR